MCCFSGPVLTVRATRIFARALEGPRQLVVYETAFAAANDLAMVLPIPVPEGTADDAVRFVDLSNEALFFERLDIAFVSRQALGIGAPQSAGAPYRAPPLVVHEVGEFQASFVPSRADFARLDPSFRLEPDVIDALGARASYGFVVVQLRKRATPVRVHPIGFTYPTRDPARLFFPTVHVHDGQVHDHADFDHYLFCQADPLIEPYLAPTFRPSPMRAEEHMNLALAAGVIDAGRCCYFRRLKGLLKNQDTVVSGPDTGAGRSHHFSVHDFPASLHGLLGYTLRVVPPTARITDEYQARRVNLFTDTKGKIFDIVFG